MQDGSNKPWGLPLVDERGATSVEYALLMALIAGTIIAAVVLFGDAVQGLFDVDFPGG